MLHVEEPLRTPPGAVLVRVFAHGASWVRSLPPVPAGRTVTVTVSSPALTRVPADDLVSHGYRLAGVWDSGRRRGAGETVDLLVPADLAEAHPAWWSELLRQAARAFDLDLGPVQALLGDEVALHLDAVEREP